MYNFKFAINMKYYILIFVAIFFFNCSDKSVAPETLTGTSWAYTKASGEATYIYAGASQTVDAYRFYQFSDIEFTSDSEVITTVQGVNTKGAWKIEGDYLSMSSQYISFPMYFQVKVSGSKMTLLCDENAMNKYLEAWSYWYGKADYEVKKSDIKYEFKKK